MGSDLQHVQAEPVGGPGLRRTAATFGVARARERRRGAPRVLLLAGAPPVVLAQRVVDVDDAVATVRPVDGPDLRAEKTEGGGMQQLAGINHAPLWRCCTPVGI